MDITAASGAAGPSSILGGGILGRMPPRDPKEPSQGASRKDFLLLAFIPTRHYTSFGVGRQPRSAGKGRGEMDFPKCQKCNNGILIPLSDYGQEGSSVFFKAWVCTNPDCGFSLRVDKGEVSYGKKVEHKH
jgi:hypothetical protein